MISWRAQYIVEKSDCNMMSLNGSGKSMSEKNYAKSWRRALGTSLGLVQR